MNLAGKRVVVMGLGRFGGGAGVARYCVEQGARVLVTDQDPADKLTAGLKLIENLPVELRLGEHRESDFTDTDVLIVNPAVKPDNLYVAAAIAAGVAITSEIRLLAAHLPNRSHTIAITGSAGKSTTTAMVGHALNKAIGSEHVHVGGNIGGSLLGQIDRIGHGDWVVLELSSFMLDGLKADRWSPHIAVVTNVSANHLDWHGSFEHYLAAKQAIFAYQQPGDIAILTQEALPHFSPVVSDMRIAPAASLWQDELLVPGVHNRINAQVAATILEAAIGQSAQDTAKAIEDFPGLSHRLQFICEHSDVRFYNDSKATTPQASTLAIDSFPPGCVHVILGGYDKKSDLSDLARHAAGRCAAIYTIGSTGPAIAVAALATEPRRAVVHQCETLENAVSKAVTNVYRGDVVLLSTGCASWDQYENYEARGRHFAQLAFQYTGEDSPNPPSRPEA